MPFFRTKQPNSTGFTLVEMMVTIGLIGIAAAIAIPNFLAFLPNWRAKNAARDLYSNMQLAKITAVKNRQPCSITYSTSPHRYTIGCLSKTVVLSDYGSGVRFQGPDGVAFGVGTITFNTVGLSNAGYAYISSADGSVYYRVGPQTSGAVWLHKWNGSSWQ